jgi:hypothetical protein
VNASIISALAALIGTAVGGLTSVVANWLSQRLQIRAQWLNHERSHRQTLYRDFIEEAAKCYMDALQHDKIDVAGLVSLYAKISRMRVQSSTQVVQSAGKVARTILETYLEPDKNLAELHDMTVRGTIDFLREFSTACREEFEDMRAQQF